MASFLPVYRFAETQFGFPNLGLDVDYPGNFITSHDKIPALNKRSRGRHDPGDGKYVNRWVMAKGVETRENAFLSYESEYVYEDPDVFLHPVHQYVRWNSTGYFRAWIECRHSTPGYYNPWWICNVVADISFDGTVEWQAGSRSFRLGATGSYNNGSHFSIPLGSETDMSEGAAAAAMRSLIGTARDYPGAFHTTHMSSLTYHRSVTEVPPDLQFSGEMAGWDDRADLLPHFGLDGAMATAFVQAVDGLPNLDSMNNIANCFEWLDLLKSTLMMFIHPGDLDSIGKWGDAWLGYRYSYSTTKADLSEAASYMERIMALSRTDHIRSNGSCSQGEWRVRCSLTLETSAFAGLRSTLEKYGLALTAYNAWDMVPYSFIVDWFLAVGDLLELYNSRNMAFRLKNRGAWFSVERSWTNEFGFKEKYYYRYFATPNLAWCSRESHGSRTVTWLKRALDVLALFF